MLANWSHMLEALEQRLRPWLAGPTGPRTWLLLAWYVCLTYGSVFATHYWMWSEGVSPSISEMLATHDRVIQEVDLAPVQYRYVAYALPELLHRVLGVSVSAGYGLVRVGFALLSAVLFHFYLSAWLDWKLTVIGVLVLVATLPFLTAQKDLQPTDMVSLALLLMTLLALRKRQPAWLLITVPLAMLFRETAIYQLLVWLVIMITDRTYRNDLGLFSGASLLAIAVYAGIRLYFGDRLFAYDFITLWGNFRLADRFVETFLALNIFWFISWLGLRKAPRFLLQTSVLAPITFGTVWLLGNPAETRLWLPVFPVLIPLGLLALNQGVESANPPTALTP